MAAHEKIPTEPPFHEVDLTRRLYRSHLELLERLLEAKDVTDVNIAAGLARQELDELDA